MVQLAFHDRTETFARDLVAFTGSLPKPLTAQNLDASMAYQNCLIFLQKTRRGNKACAIDPKHAADSLLPERKHVAAQLILAAQQPSAQALLQRMVRRADHQLNDGGEDGFVVPHQAPVEALIECHGTAACVARDAKCFTRNMHLSATDHPTAPQSRRQSQGPATSNGDAVDPTAVLKKRDQRYEAALQKPDLVQDLAGFEEDLALSQSHRVNVLGENGMRFCIQGLQESVLDPAHRAALSED